MYLNGVVRRPASDGGLYSAGWNATEIDLIRLENTALKRIYRENSWCLCRANVWEDLPQTSEPLVPVDLFSLSVCGIPLSSHSPILPSCLPAPAQLALSLFLSAQVTVFAPRRVFLPPPAVSSCPSSATTAPTGWLETALASILFPSPQLSLAVLPISLSAWRERPV